MEYNFTYPVHGFHEEIYTYHKYTIDVSWTVVAPKHIPILRLQYWSHNDTDSYAWPLPLEIQFPRLTQTQVYTSAALPI